MPKRKTVFSDELRQKYPCFRKGNNDFEAECITCAYAYNYPKTCDKFFKRKTLFALYLLEKLSSFLAMKIW